MFRLREAKMSCRTKRMLLVSVPCAILTLISFCALRPNKMEGKGTFSCAVNCMDGRVQDAVKNYIKNQYGVDYVDVVTEPGPNKILAERTDKPVVDNIKKRLEISVHHHGAKVVALAGHFGCAGNPVGKEEQVAHLKEAKKTIESFGLNVKIILLWVGEGWQKAELVE